MTGLLAHHWNAEHGGAAEVGGASEPQLLERWRKFIRRMLVAAWKSYLDRITTNLAQSWMEPKLEAVSRRSSRNCRQNVSSLMSFTRFKITGWPI